MKKYGNKYKSNHSGSKLVCALISAIYLLLSSASLQAEITSIFNQSSANQPTIHKQFYLELGKEEQYIEILSHSETNPVLLFIHGGPAWPQTPQLRYYSAELAKKYTLVIWEQRGAGKSYMKNPNPSNLSLQQILNDGHELTGWLKAQYNQEKIYLAGYSWGSMLGAKLAYQYPNDYKAYIGIAQITNLENRKQVSLEWLEKQVIQGADANDLALLEKVKDVSNYESELDRFFEQWLMLNKYGGAIYSETVRMETDKAIAAAPDYAGYDWFAVWERSAKVLQRDMELNPIDGLTSFEVPVFLLQGRHDWNVPSVLAEAWLNNVSSPSKKLFWFEYSGHSLLEEEFEKFNDVLFDIAEIVEAID